MARELRSRKSVSEARNGETKSKVAEKTTVKSKRKATSENDSPIPRKLQKATKKAIATDDEEKPAAAETKSKKKAAAPVEEPDEASDSESDEGEEAQTLATELDPEDEDAPEEETVYKPGQAVGTIPDVSQAVEEAAKSTSDGEPGVIYIGRIPHGFYEHEMRQYFSQFGTINKLRLSRNKQTGASKHFAFIEFADAATADIVAKTMNNYLLFGHILKCRTVPKSQVHEDLFKGANRRFKKVPWNKIAGKQLEKPLAEATWEKKVAREQSKRAKKSAKLKAMGYEFQAPELKEVPPPGAELEETDKEVKAIEEGSADEQAGDEGEEQTGVEEKVVTKKPGKKEVEVKSISAPKAKAKKGTTSKKVKA